MSLLRYRSACEVEIDIEALIEQKDQMSEMVKKESTPTPGSSPRTKQDEEENNNSMFYH